MISHPYTPRPKGGVKGQMSAVLYSVCQYMYIDICLAICATALTYIYHFTVTDWRGA